MVEQKEEVEQFKIELVILCKKYNFVLCGGGDYGIEIFSYVLDRYGRINWHKCIEFQKWISVITPDGINTD